MSERAIPESPAVATSTPEFARNAAQISDTVEVSRKEIRRINIALLEVAESLGLPDEDFQKLNSIRHDIIRLSGKGDSK